MDGYTKSECGGAADMAHHIDLAIARSRTSKMARTEEGTTGVQLELTSAPASQMKCFVFIRESLLHKTFSACRCQQLWWNQSHPGHPRGKNTRRKAEKKREE